MSHPTFGEEDKIHGVDPILPSTFGEKAKNFWYHYKWHTIFAAAILAIVLVVSLQMCSRVSYDAYVMVASDEYLVSLQVRGIQEKLSALTPDYNGDGKSLLTVQSYYIGDPEELRDSGVQNAGNLAAQSRENYELFRNELMTGTYKILLLTPKLYEELNEEGMLLSLPDYVPGLPGEALYGENQTGVALSALPLYRDPAMQVLPANTILCFRKLSVVSADKQALENHADALRKWLSAE